MFHLVCFVQGVACTLPQTFPALGRTAVILYQKPTLNILVLPARSAEPSCLLGSQGDFVSRLITPIIHIGTLIIPVFTDLLSS